MRRKKKKRKDKVNEADVLAAKYISVPCGEE